MSDRGRRTARRRSTRRGVVVLLLVGVVGVVGLGAACSDADETRPDAAGPVASSPSDEPDASVPRDSVPEESVPDGSVPEESAPDSAPATPPDDGTEPSEPSDPPEGGEPPIEEGPDVSASDDDEVDPVLVALAVLGFVVLVGVAARWMLRRDDPDDEIGRPDRRDWPDEQMSL